MWLVDEDGKKEEDKESERLKDLQLSNIERIVDAELWIDGKRITKE